MFAMDGGREDIAGVGGLTQEDLALDRVAGGVQDQNLIPGDLVPSVLGQDMEGDCPLMVALAEVVIAMVVHVHQSTVVPVMASVMRDMADIETNIPDYTLLNLREQNG